MMDYGLWFRGYGGRFMGFRVQGLGSREGVRRVNNLGYRVEGLRSNVEGLGFRV
jgi:hypothetical protein